MSQVRAEAGLEGGETQTKYTESPALRVLTTPSFSRGASTVGGPSGATETTTKIVTSFGEAVAIQKKKKFIRTQRK